MGKVLLTGADSFLGNYVLAELVERGFNVIALINGEPLIDLADKSSLVTLVDASLNSRAHLSDYLRDCHYVIQIPENSLAIPNRSEILPDIDPNFTKCLIETALANGVERFIHINSAQIFQAGTFKKPADETYPLRKIISGADPLNALQIAYRNIKTGIEAHQLPAITLCPTFMLGAYEQFPNYSAILLALYDGGLQYYTNGGRNYIFAKDVATGVVNALSRGKVGSTYILGNQNWNYREIFTCIGTCMDVSPPERFVPTWLAIIFGMIDQLAIHALFKEPRIRFPVHPQAYRTCYYSAAKALQELDLPQTPIEQAVQSCFEWQKSSGWLAQRLPRLA